MRVLWLALAVTTLTFQLTAQINCTQGDCINGKGTCVFPSGAKYIGDFKDGSIHGQGTLHFTDGRAYTGQWKNQFREGEGTMTFASGDEYEGQFKRNKFYGFGTMRYANQNRYEGNWRNDLPNGYGVFYYANGDRYEGNFENGQCEGIGTLFYKDGSFYKGQWHHNKRHGKGEMEFPDGEQIKGEWSDDQYLTDWTQLGFNGDTLNLRDCNSVFCADGYGKFRYRDGSIYIGDFVSGLPEGRGTVYYSNGDQYEGGWSKHAPHGRGVMYYATGKVIGAVWEYGKPKKKLYAENEGFTNEIVTMDKDPQIKIWAVVVGAARYSHMPTLRYTDDDAYQIYAFLKSPEGGALPDNQVRLLVDEDATRANVLNAMRRIFLRADDNDVVLFYFSGHGLQGSFLPIDYDGYNNRLNHEEIRNLLKASRAKHKLVIADACHSGSLLSMRDEDKSLNSLLSKYYEAFQQARAGTALLMSSKGEEYSLEDGGLRSGIFSHFLVRGLKGEADKDTDKIITIEEIYDFVHQNVRLYTGNIQTPTLTGDYDNRMPVGVVR